MKIVTGREARDATMARDLLSFFEKKEQGCSARRCSIPSSGTKLLAHKEHLYNVSVLVQGGLTAQKGIVAMAQALSTILLVDNSMTDRTLYRYFLSSTATYTFLESTTGGEGLRSCQTNQPDCLILDFYLPDMD